MQETDTRFGTARLIAMGDEALMQGFALIGFETWPAATDEDLNRLLGELAGKNVQALVLLQSRLARSKVPNLKRVLSEGGRVVIAEIPPLEAPAGFQSAIEEKLKSVIQPGIKNL
jgi:vacuolar-type H+-ATPase subunit F/Vma7